MKGPTLIDLYRFVCNTLKLLKYTSGQVLLILMGFQIMNFLSSIMQCTVRLLPLMSLKFPAQTLTSMWDKLLFSIEH